MGKRNVVTGFLIILFGFGLTACQDKPKMVLKEESLTLEYGENISNDASNYLSDDSDDDVIKSSTITVENIKEDILKKWNLKKDDKNLEYTPVGNYDVYVNYKDSKLKLNIVVKDTKKPEITLNKDEVSITIGDKLDLTKNIKSVIDPIDGEIKYSKKQIDKDGYYIDDSKLDIKKVGKYEINVIAKDKNGNKTEKTFIVKVNKKEEVEKNSESTSTTGNNDVGNSYPSNSEINNNNTPSNNQGTTTNNGNSSSGTEPKPVEPKPDPKPTTCEANNQWKSLGNSGVAFYDDNMAYDWSLENAPENKGATIITVHDVCGKVGYSIEWFDLTQ